MRLSLFIALLLVAFASAQVGRRRANKIKNGNRIDDNQVRVVCYYTNWSVYRKGHAKYTPQNINPYLCTHLIYAFGGMTDDFELTPFDSYQDIDKGGYSQFNGLKQYNKKLKTLLAVGGWNEGSPRFSEMVAYPEYRHNFTRSAIRYLRRYRFDGLDLDWEYPAAREGSAPEDKENYATLVQELREAFEEEGKKVAKGRLLLTMAVPAGLNYIDKGYDVPKLNRFLDFINILSYDYHSVYEPSVNHHAPLMGQPGASEYESNAQLNVAETVKYYLSKGASKNKLVVGIPTYGRTYTLLDPGFPELGSSADGPGIKGNYTNEKGYMAFFEVCQAIASHGWKVRKPYPKRIGPFAFKGNQWVGYDDEHIAARKAEYVRDTKLGGIMFWSLDSADFRGICNGKRYPLIEAAKEALLTKSMESENEARSFQTLSKNKQRTDIGKLSPLNQLPDSRKRPDSSLKQSTISPFNTPEPPTTPSTVAAYTCKREGFFPNPDNCHKYFWCLGSASSGLGIVPHAFSCPSGLIFNKRISGCDNPGPSVKCNTKAKKGPSRSSVTTTPIPTTTEFDYTLLDDYDYYYYDYIYEDYPLNETLPIEQSPVRIDDVRNSVGGQIKKEPTVETVNTDKSPSQRTRPQYSAIERERNTAGSDLPKELKLETLNTNKSPSQRTRPQYSAIERDRSRNPQRPDGTGAETSSDLRGNDEHRKPEYITLNRQRPSHLPIDDLEYYDLLESEFPTTDRSLQYVTLDRNRPSTEPSLFEVNEIESSTRSGINYNTISRDRPSTESSSSIDSLLEVFTSSSVPPPVETSSRQLPRIRIPTTTTKKPGRRLPSRRKIELLRESAKIEPLTESPDIINVEKEVESKDEVTAISRNTLPVPGRRRIPSLNLEERRKASRDQARGATRQTTTRAPHRNELEDKPKVISTNRQNTRRDPLLLRTRQPINNVEQIDRNRQRVVSNEVPRPHIRNPFESLDTLSKKTDKNTVKDDIKEVLKLEEISALIVQEELQKEQSSSALGKEEISTLAELTPEDREIKEIEDLVNETLLTLISPEIEESLVELITEELRPTSEKTIAEETLPELKIDQFLSPKPVLPESESTSNSPFSFLDIISSKIINPPKELKEVEEVLGITTQTPIESTTRRFFIRTTTEEVIQRTTSSTPIRTTTLLKPRSSAAPITTTARSRESFRSRTRIPPTTRRRPPTTKPLTTLSPLTKQSTTSLPRTTKRTRRPLITKSTTQSPQTSKPVRTVLPVTFRRQKTTERSTTKRPQTSKPSTTERPQTTKPSTTERPQRTKPSTTERPQTTKLSTTRRQETTKRLTTPRPKTTRRFTTRRPHTTKPPITRRPSITRRSTTKRPSTSLPEEYEYIYDYYNEGALGGDLGQLAALTQRAMITVDGKIKCFDTGYFPHPHSCKKFISCSKTVRGQMKGWTYTCPQNLVFDPVGGMCNWSEDVDCLA